MKLAPARERAGGQQQRHDRHEQERLRGKCRTGQE